MGWLDGWAMLVGWLGHGFWRKGAVEGDFLSEKLPDRDVELLEVPVVDHILVNPSFAELQEMKRRAYH